jgi:hypothetical protein
MWRGVSLTAVTQNVTKCHFQLTNQPSSGIL